MAKTRPGPEVKFIVCEDVRSEQGGKVTLLGVYPGDSIVVNRAPQKQKLPEGAVALLMRLSIVAFVKGGSGTVMVDASLVGPSGQKILEGNFGEASLLPDKSATLIVQGGPFVIPEFGRYKATFQLGRSRHLFEFDIVAAANFAYANVPSQQEPLVKPKRKKAAGAKA